MYCSTGRNWTTTSRSTNVSTSKSTSSPASSRGAMMCCFTVKSWCTYVMVVASGRTVTRRATFAPGTGCRYAGTLK